jgi:hypothetical protein
MLPKMPLRAQQLTLDEERASSRRSPRKTATIHWQGVTLGDVVDRLRPVFDDTVFIDRRVDPSRRVSLDIEAVSAEQVVSALATDHELGVGRLGTLIYLGPPIAGELRAIAAARSREAARLPTALRTTLLGKKPISWPRLSEPRDLVAKLVALHGWQLAEAERIPHDIWAAGNLPELTVVEQLTILTFGFGMTFELRPAERTVAIVPLPSTVTAREALPARRVTESKPRPPRTMRGTRQVYTLRVQEKPVGAVLRELSQRLRWTIQIDEEAIRAAGKSLDQRVSFSVENADRETLLDALLTPAGLEYHISGEQIRIIPRRYVSK